MTIPSKFNPFGISKNKNRMPTDGLDFYAPFENNVNDVINGLVGTIGNSNYYQIVNDGTTIGNFLQCTNTSNDSSQALYYNNSENLLQYETGDFSMSFWIQAPNWNKYDQNCVFSKKGNDRTQGILLYRDSNRSNKLVMRTGSYVGLFATYNNFVNKEWVHWCFVRNNGTYYWYRNGVLDTSATYTNYDNVTNTSQKIYIGWNTTWTTNGYFNIKALRIYGKALTLDEIGLLSNEFSDIKYGIVAYDQECTFSPVSNSSVSIVYSTGGTVNSFEITSGSLPSNISFNTSTGTFSGIATTDADHTYNLVIRLSGPDVIPKTINYTVYTVQTSKLEAPSPQSFNFISEGSETQYFSVTKENEFVSGYIYSGELPPLMNIVMNYNNVGLISWGQQTEPYVSSFVVQLKTQYHPDPVLVTCNVTVALNQITASNQSFKFYAGEGVMTRQVQYSSQKSITPVYNISETLPNGITFNSATGEFTSDGSQTVQEIKTIQLTISSSTGCSTPAVIDVTLEVEPGKIPAPNDYVFYASLSSALANTAETGQSLTYVNTPSAAVVSGINCLYFDTEFEVKVSDTTGLPTGSNPFTLSIWANKLEINSESFAYSIGRDSFYRAAFMGYNASQKYMYGSWGRDITTNTTAELNKWVNLVFVYENGIMKLYVDNVLIDSNNLTLYINYGQIYIGSYIAGRKFYGYLANARIYKRALNIDEIKGLYNELDYYLHPFIKIPDQTIDFNTSQGAETIALDYSTNLSSGIVFGLSGTLPTGVTFDSTSGTFTSSGTQSANESAEVIISGSYNDGITNISDLALININVYAASGIPTSGLVFYAPLVSSINDEFGKTLTTQGTATVNQEVDGLTGTLLDANSFIYATDSTNLPQGHHDLTLSIYYKHNSNDYSSPQFPFHIGNEATNKHIEMGIWQNHWHWNIYHAPYEDSFGTPDSDWHSLILTYDDTSKDVKMYVDGELGSSGNIDNYLDITYGNLILGARRINGSCATKGCYIKAARVYNRVLSLTEISSLVHEFDEEPVGPVMPTSGLTMYHSLSNSLTHPEIGSDFTVVGNGCTLTTQDGIQCMQITPPENGFSYLEYSGSNEYYSNSNTEITVSIWAKFIGEIQYSTDAHCFMLGEWVGDFKQMYLCTFRQKYGIKICGGDDWQNWGFTADNRWHHLVGTSNSSGLTKFYVDGTLYRTYQLNGSLNITNDYVVIGSHMNQNWNGYLAGARIYNRELTSGEIETLSKEYDVSDPIITDSLTMYMPMKDNLSAAVGTPLSSVMTNPPSATVEDGIKCYYFDGSNCLYGDDASYFTTFNSSDAPHCTLCYWFKYDTTSQLERYAAQIGYQDNDYSACIHYNLTWNDVPQICQSQYGHWTEPLILGSEAANGWHLYVIRIQTWDFGEGEYWIYQDGYVNSTEYEGSGRSSTWGNFCMHPMIAIGGQVSLTNHSTGNIDCIKGWYTGIRMYNKVLSAEEIAAIAAEFPTSN